MRTTAHSHDAPAPTAVRAQSALELAAAKRAERKARKVTSRRMPESAVYVLEKMSHGFRRAGREAGAGFYDYPAQAEPVLWPGLAVFARTHASPAAEAVAERLKFAVLCEALRHVGDGTLASTQDLTKHAELPASFPDWVDQAAHGDLRTRAAALEAAHGPRFAIQPRRES